MTPRLCFALPILALIATPVPAQDFDASRPYELHLVLDIAKHRLLTPVFKEQVKRELQDGLRTAFGDMVRVTVLDKHARLEDVRKRGLGEPLDSWRDLTGVKTHFVLIDYVDGQYEVRTRQHDGLTGLCSPVVRRERITDRLFVARQATFLIHRDFGLVGQIVERTNLQKVKVEFKGAKLGAPLTRWLKKGEVLKFAPILASNTARRVDDTFLQVDEIAEDGTCICKFYHRFKDPFAQGKQFRCLHLHTIQAPLNVQLLQAGAKTRVPAPNLSVVVRRHGFKGEEGSTFNVRSDNEGIVSTEKQRSQLPFDRLAFLTVELRANSSVIVPVAIVDERPVLVRLPVKEQTAQNLLQVRKEIWDQQAYEAGLVQKDLFRELKDMEAKPNLREKALARAKLGREESEKAVERLSSERDDIEKAAKGTGDKIELAAGNQWIKYLETGNTQLDVYIRDQEKIFKDERDPKRLEYRALRQQARLEEARAEFTKALELYEKAIGFGFDDPELKKDYELLRTRWEPKDEEHRKARLWLETVFAGADLVKNPGVVKDAREAYLQCRRVNDLLGCQKMTRMLLAHAGNLKQQSDALMPDVNEEDRKTLEVIADVSAELRKLGLDLQAFIGK